MITSIRLKDFKSFGDETLRLGPFTILVGANATGKSNLLDALRFLHGVARGYTLTEIIGGKFGAGGQQEWEQIRGGPNEIIRKENRNGVVSEASPPAFGIQVTIIIANIEYIYKIEVSRDYSKADQFRITFESLQMNSQIVYEKQRSTPDDRRVSLSEYVDRNAIHLESLPEEIRHLSSVDVDLGRPVLSQIKEHRYARFIELPVDPVIDALSQCRFLSFSPDRMRIPSYPGNPLGECGENLSSVLKEICSDHQRSSILKSWVNELTPMNVAGLKFRKDFSERIHLAVQEKSGKLFSAHSISDGTLRFLAMAAVLLKNDESCLYVLEDIESGIHPARLHLLADLFERNTHSTNVQVLATTHSPALLTVVNDDTFKHISVAYRLEESDASIIRSITDLPNVRKLKTSHGLGRLLSGGWMETTLEFMETRVD